MEKTKSHDALNLDKAESKSKETSKAFKDLRSLKVEELRGKIADNKAGSGLGALKITSSPKFTQLHQAAGG